MYMYGKREKEMAYKIHWKWLECQNDSRFNLNMETTLILTLKFLGLIFQN